MHDTDGAYPVSANPVCLALVTKENLGWRGTSGSYKLKTGKYTPVFLDYFSDSQGEKQGSITKRI